MTVALDTNVLVALWDASDALHSIARVALEAAASREGLVICAAVYAELIGAPGRGEAFVDRFCEEAGVAVEWELSERVWRAAGNAFREYAARRKRHGGAEPRRLLADFLIGAHAFVSGYKLLSLDEGLYRKAFPGLKLELV